MMQTIAADRKVWDHLLATARATHEAHPALQAFCPFPDDLRPQDVAPFEVSAAAVMAAETGLYDGCNDALRDAFLAAGGQALWHETYKGTDIGQDFMDRFGCFCLIGEGGAFHSDRMRAWMVYMPPHLHYRWHHHPAEEMYLTVAGDALFMRAGCEPEILYAGDTSTHASNQPHAMETGAHPIMAYVIWRNGFDMPPMLTDSLSALPETVPVIPAGVSPDPSAPPVGR